jgi:hypothetical protein
MLVIMRKRAKEEDLIHVKQFLVNRDYDFHQSTGINRTIIGVIGDTEKLDTSELGSMPGVLQVIRIEKEE